jgi:putative endonuclease
MIKQPAVYILASRPNGTLYIGVSSNLLQRVWQHKSGVVDGFTDRYDVHLLVYFEMHTEMLAAVTREKHLKKWKRDWKIALI